MWKSREPDPGGAQASWKATDEECVLVLQGGGALGAYQAGAFEALSAEGYEPDWLAGISIGAINAAIIAGNPPERRVERLQAFWRRVTSGPAPLAVLPRELDRSYVNAGAAAMAVAFGAPGFFSPRALPAPLQPRNTLEAISFYDTAPLRRTLEELVDFERLNAGPMRISVGAVNVRTGNFVYFDTRHQKIDVRHVMASAALPPGFPPVEIDGDHYWDGGLVSNTPLQYVLDRRGEQRRLLVFQVDLFPARGDLPGDLDQAGGREKDIRYSSRTRLNTDQELQWQEIAQAAQRLIAKLPPELAGDPDAQILGALPVNEQGVDVVHLIYRSRPHEGHAKDYEFSRLSMSEHWAAGRVDVKRTLRDPLWLSRELTSCTVRVFDIDGPEPRREPDPRSAADGETP